MATPDAISAAPKFYSVDSEDDRVRVLRARYGPKEKSVMHSHPAHVAVALTDAHLKFSDPSGNAQEVRVNAGQIISMPAGSHLIENLDDRAFEGVLVELKGG